MVFSSVMFLFYFLPILLLVYFICPVKYRNFVLLFFSLLFYFIGEPINIIFLLLSCFINYYGSVLINKNKSKKTKKFIFIGIIIYNIIQLLFFKYINFFISNLNYIPFVDIPLLNILMPIGISFYTFQAISYVCDVYSGKVKPAKTIFTYMTYLTLFPQLIAGPIVRYETIEDDLKDRSIKFDNVSTGLKLFIIGLSKKVLLANVLGELINKFVVETVVSSWMRPILYTLQIYFDFSGYSDMAIGLGLVFGFHFLKNFNYPLIAKSITDFWRRWHMSLSSFFRDYVYIPLGGNRVSKPKWIRNILVVWFLTGFWHGASWNFILWGVYFGIILLIEKFLIGKYLEKTKVFKHIYTLIIVIISFLIFSTDNINNVFISLGNMFFLNDLEFINSETIYYLKDYFMILIISIISCTPLFKNIYIKYKDNKIISFIEPIVLIGLFILCVAFIIDASFNPFLYFRF
ncbi:MAG: MBOAT family protein [Bacilli bacterium]|nr:MBOAT family protein [Bacilli bacterium]